MERTAKALREVEDYIKSPTAGLPQEVQQQLTNKLQEAKEKIGSPLETDRWVYRFVVGFLGLAILGSLACTFFLQYTAYTTKDAQALKIPEIFLAIGSAAVGALAGLLAPSPGRGTQA
jgi:hypothetical protein